MLLCNRFFTTTKTRSRTAVNKLFNFLKLITHILYL